MTTILFVLLIIGAAICAVTGNFSAGCFVLIIALWMDLHDRFKGIWLKIEKHDEMQK